MFDTMILTELYKILSYILLHHRCEVLVLNFLLLSQLVLPLVWMVTLFFSFNRDCGVISILHCIMIRLIQIRECWLVSTHVIGTACIQIPHILVGFLLCMTHHQKRYFLSLKVRLSTIFVSFATSFSLIFLVWLLRVLLLRVLLLDKFSFMDSSIEQTT